MDELVIALFEIVVALFATKQGFIFLMILIAIGLIAWFILGPMMGVI